MQFFTFVSILAMGSELVSKINGQVNYIPTSTFGLGAGEKNTIMMLTNNLRARINPPPINMRAISYNNSLEAAISSFLNVRDANWVFQNSTGYYSDEGGIHNNWNGFIMMQYPEFKAWEPYCTFWLHDTMARPDLVTNIFRFRLQQENCFDWSACLNKPYLKYFQSCVPALQRSPGAKPCAYTDQFLVRMLLNFDSAAVIGINHKGPFTPYPKKQLLSFWGWGCSSTGIKEVSENGYPYKAGGARASQCDNEHPVASKGLCYKLKP